MLKYPTNRAYMCRKLLADFMISTYLILMKTVIGELIELGKAHHDKSKRIITLPNKSQIFYGGLDDKEGGVANSALRRIKSTEFGVVAIDEANEITEDDFKWADTRLRHKLDNGQFPPFYVLLASNPCQNWIKNRFIDNPNPSQDVFIQSLTDENPHNPPGYSDHLRATFRSKEWEDVFILGSWSALREPDQLIPYTALQKCVKVVPTRMGGRGGVISIDTALMGDDECVIQYWRQNQLIDQRIFPFVENSMSIVGEARQMKDLNKATLYVVDSVGCGDGVAGRLEEVEGYGCVKRIVGGAVPEPDYMINRPPDMQPNFANLKSQMWWYMRDMVLDRAVSFQDNTDTPVLLGQLSSMKYKIHSDKKIQIETKEQYKKRCGKSPDRADAAVMAVWGLRSAPDPKEYFDLDDDDYEFMLREKKVSNYGFGARTRAR